MRRELNRQPGSSRRELPPSKVARVQQELEAINSASPTLPQHHIHRQVLGWLLRKSEDYKTRSALVLLCYWVADSIYRRDVPINVMTWNATTLSKIASKIDRGGDRSDHTIQKQRSRLSAFALHLQSVSEGVVLRDVELFAAVRGQELDFRRRTNIPTTAEVIKMIKKVARLKVLSFTTRDADGKPSLKTVNLHAADRALCALSLILMALLGIRPKECSRLRISNFDWDCPEGPRVMVKGTKSGASRRMLSLNRMESIHPGAIEMVKALCEQAIQSRAANVQADTLLFSSTFFGEEGQFHHRNMNLVLHRVEPRKMSVYVLRHHFATATLISFIEKYGFSSPNKEQEPAVNFLKSPAQAESGAGIRLLQGMGHSNIYSLAQNYFHCPELLRFRAINN